MALFYPAADEYGIYPNRSIIRHDAIPPNPRPS